MEDLIEYPGIAAGINFNLKYPGIASKTNRKVLDNAGISNVVEAVRLKHTGIGSLIETVRLKYEGIGIDEAEPGSFILIITRIEE